MFNLFKVGEEVTKKMTFSFSLLFITFIVDAGRNGKPFKNANCLKDVMKNICFYFT
jgi:hypothetical protein